MTTCRIIGAAALTGLIALSFLGCRKRSDEVASAGAAATEPTPIPARLTLFFPGGDTLLHRETREVPELPVTAPARARLVVEELLAGSRQGYASPFPWPAALSAVFVDRDGNAYLDLSLPPRGAVEGSATEVALAFATVNSVVANCPGVERVQLLFGGREVSSLGHLDLSRPLQADPNLVAP